MALIGVAVACGQSDEAVEHGGGLLSPTQQRLPDALTAPLQAALQAWDDGQPDAARARLQAAVEAAQATGHF